MFTVIANITGNILSNAVSCLPLLSLAKQLHSLGMPAVRQCSIASTPIVSSACLSCRLHTNHGTSAFQTRDCTTNSAEERRQL